MNNSTTYPWQGAYQCAVLEQREWPAPSDRVKTRLPRERIPSVIIPIYLQGRHPECGIVLCGSVRWLSRLHQGRTGVPKCLGRPTPEFSLRGFWLRYGCCSLLWSLDSLTNLTPRPNLR